MPLTKSARDSLLAKVPLFEGLSKKELKHVLNECQQEHFAAGKKIVEEGKPGGRFYLIESGIVNVLKGSRKQTSLGPGDFFGEMSIFDKKPRSASVVAETSVEALSIASWNFLSLLEENWGMARKVLQALTSRIRNLEDSPTH